MIILFFIIFIINCKDNIIKNPSFENSIQKINYLIGELIIKLKYLLILIQERIHYIGIKQIKELKIIN